MKPYFPIFLTSVFLAACSASEDPVDTCRPGSDGEIVFSFHLSTPESGPASRYDVEGHDEVESEYLLFENGVDINDIAMYVFARMKSEDEGSERLVAQFTPNIPQNLTYTPEDMEVLGGFGNYTVNFMLDRKQFANAMGTAITSTGTDDVFFRIVMFTNSTIPSGTSATPNYGRWKVSDGIPPASLFSKTGDWRETMGYIYNNPNNNSNTLYQVSDLYPNPGSIDLGNGKFTSGKKYMPMFGQATFTVRQKDLIDSGPLNRFFLGDFLLLRSVAKIRVVDNIQNKKADGYPKIVGAQITGDQDLIALLPHDAINYVNGTQVHYPHVGTPGSDTPNIYKLGYIPDGWTISPSVNRKGYVFVGYCPEQTIHNDEYTVTPCYPIINIAVAISKDASGNDVIKNYDFHMHTANTTPDGFGSYILRNHIYTLSVDRVQLEGLSINVAVKDWQKYNYIYEY